MVAYGAPINPHLPVHTPPHPYGLPAWRLLCAGLAGLRAAATAVQAERPAQILAAYSASASAGTPAAAARSQQFFNALHGHDWQCATCHGTVPVQAGKHAATGKPIAALAPAVNDRRFCDLAKVEKWFGHNCKDVIGRACSAAEKADVLAWLITLKP